MRKEHVVLKRQSQQKLVLDPARKAWKYIRFHSCCRHRSGSVVLLCLCERSPYASVLLHEKVHSGTTDDRNLHAGLEAKIRCQILTDHLLRSSLEKTWWTQGNALSGRAR
jgi:hypothetical protein